MIYFRVENFQGIKLVLRTELRHLHNVLKKWPDPPTFSAAVTFGALHSHQIRDIRQKIIRHQFEFTVILSETTFIPDEDEFAVALSSLLTSNPTSEPQLGKDGIDVQVIPDRDPYELFTVAEVEDREENPHPVSTELVDLLLALPRTMRLSHLVQTLQHIHEITTSPFSSEYSAFRSDVEGILNLAKELDKRLLNENHFSKDVLTEL